MNIISHAMRGALLCVTLSAPLHAASDFVDCVSEDTLVQPLFQEQQRTHSRAYPIQAIEHEAINAQHQELVVELKLNTLARYAINSAKFALVGYVVYTLWQMHTDSKEPNASTAIPINEQMSGAVTQGQLQQVKDQLHDHLQKNHPERFTWQWCKNHAFSLGESVINVALVHAVFNGGINAIMHEGNLEWFIRTHTHCFDVISELIEYAHTHDRGTSSERENRHNKEQIMYATTNFMNDMTAILGFMSYSKTRATDPNIQLQISKLIEYFTIFYNESARTVSEALENDSAVVPHIAKMNFNFNRLQESFKRLEWELGAGV